MKRSINLCLLLSTRSRGLPIDVDTCNNSWYLEALLTSIHTVVVVGLQRLCGCYFLDLEEDFQTLCYL